MNSVFDIGSSAYIGLSYSSASKIILGVEGVWNGYRQSGVALFSRSLTLKSNYLSNFFQLVMVLVLKRIID